MYLIEFTKQAKKDYETILKSPLRNKVATLLKKLKNDPFCPPYEKLVNDLDGMYSRRINIRHRLVYTIDKEKHIVKILSMWTHYGDN